MEKIIAAKYHYWAIACFIILSILGVMLRWMHVFPLPGFNYSFLLHAHSHFAFAGWMFFSIVILIAGRIHESRIPASYRHLFIATLISAFGMLISFSLQGYKAVSIGFSTLFIFVTYRFTYLILKEKRLKEKLGPVAPPLLIGALFFLCLSSLGPYALGPLMATGNRNSPLYQNAIYFYLHFQMNGWMLLGALSLMSSTYLSGIKTSRSFKRWLNIFIYSHFPLFLIFLLWTNPPGWVWIAAFLASALNLLSWCVLCMLHKNLFKKLPLLVKASFAAISIKGVFQVLICFPSIAVWVVSDRSLIIGYIHLITLGCVMPLIIDQFCRSNFFQRSRIETVNLLFLTGVMFYLVLLFIQPLFTLFGRSVPHFRLLLLISSLYFLVIGVLYFVKLAGSSYLRETSDKALVDKF